MRHIVDSYCQGKSLTEKVELGQDLKSEIEQVFLWPDAIDPESDLMKTISPPGNFPYDLLGKIITHYCYP